MNDEARNLREENPDDDTDDAAWLAREKSNPAWQIIRAGLAKILPDDLSDYGERGINPIGSTRVRGVDAYGGKNENAEVWVPSEFELNDENCKVRVNEGVDLNLDRLALHVYACWLRNTN
jgi:hypothetical protein